MQSIAIRLSAWITLFKQDQSHVKTPSTTAPCCSVPLRHCLVPCWRHLSQHTLVASSSTRLCSSSNTQQGQPQNIRQTVMSVKASCKQHLTPEGHPELECLHVCSEQQQPCFMNHSHTLIILGRKWAYQHRRVLTLMALSACRSSLAIQKEVASMPSMPSLGGPLYSRI